MGSPKIKWSKAVKSAGKSADSSTQGSGRAPSGQTSPWENLAAQSLQGVSLWRRQVATLAVLAHRPAPREGAAWAYALSRAALSRAPPGEG